MTKQVWKAPQTVRYSVKDATKGIGGSGVDSCGEGGFVNCS
ncbi:MAG: hypothetical protein ACQEUZ_15735 [Pseudomonadota bacterium]